MQKYEVLEKIKSNKIVAVVRGKDREDGIRIAKSCIKGGVDIIEVAYTNHSATQIIEELSQESDALIGAGTVLDIATARMSILAGAKFVVSPSFDNEVAKLCNLYQISYMSGCMSITEITTALQYGVSVIKLFPGSAFGTSFIKAVKGPLPQTEIMPTGGVSLENVNEWLDMGAVAVGVGGKLTSGSDEEIIKTAQAFVKKIRG